MRNVPFLYVFLSLFAYSFPVLGQTDEEAITYESKEYAWNEWQMELLSDIDPDQFDSRSYEQLLEMIYDLEIENHLSDSIKQSRKPLLVKQQFITSLKQSPISIDHCPQSTLRYDLNALHKDGAKWRAGIVLKQNDFTRWKSTPLWADHASIYASYAHTKGWLRQAVVGHYRLRLGCGLICNQQFSLGKNVASQSFFQHQPDLSVHASSLDEGYMQGAAARLRIGSRWEILPFVSALQSESKKYSNVRWTTHSGIRTKWMGEQYAVAANLIHTSTPDGTRLTQGSMDYQAQWMDCLFKGEVAIDDSCGWAMVNAIQYTIADSWNLTAIYRHYDDRYRQISANSISESSAMKGEHGASLVAEGELARHWTLQTYADWYRFSTPQYGICLPSQGYDLSAKAYYERISHKHQWKGWIGYRLKAKYRSDTSTPDRDIIPYYRHSIDGQLSWLSPKGFKLQTQAHTRLYSASNADGPQLGYAISQTAGYTAEDIPLSIEVQASWFHTDSYDCRLYLSERNMLHAFSIPMLNGEGMRLSSYLRYKPSKQFSAEIKHTLSRQSDSVKQALYAQIVWSF